jgi:hypothetical protein
MVVGIEDTVCLPDEAFIGAAAAVATLKAVSRNARKAEAGWLVRDL